MRDHSGSPQLVVWWDHNHTLTPNVLTSFYGLAAAYGDLPPLFSHSRRFPPIYGDLRRFTHQSITLFGQ
jgi:hypothetical protein